MSTTAKQELDALLNGLPGQVLYYRVKEWQREPRVPLKEGAQHPHTVIHDTRIKVGAEGVGTEAVTEVKSESGTQLGIVVYRDGNIRSTDLLADTTWDTPMGEDYGSITGWMASVWGAPVRAGTEGYTVKGHRTLNGSASVVFSKQRHTSLGTGVHHR